MTDILVPGGTPDRFPGARTVVLPIRAGVSWDRFAWPAHDVQDSLPYAIDAVSWLADAGTTLVSADLSSDGADGLTIALLSIAGGQVRLRIAGGTAGITARIGVLLHLGDGGALEVVVALPIVNRGAGLVPIGAPPAGNDNTGAILALVL